MPTATLRQTCVHGRQELELADALAKAGIERDLKPVGLDGLEFHAQRWRPRDGSGMAEILANLRIVDFPGEIIGLHFEAPSVRIEHIGREARE